MEGKIQIEGFKVYPNATPNQMAEYTQDLLKNDRKEMLIFQDPKNPLRYLGVVLAKYYTSDLADSTTVRETASDGAFQLIYIAHSGIRVYLGMLLRKLQNAHQQDTESFDSLLNEFITDESSILMPEEPPAKRFLKTNTPLQIEQTLNQQVIGQPQLTKAVADFLYYHGLRQLHPQLPQRPLMISGPSGNGKTEVWRAAQRLYGDVFKIQIIDGSNISCDGWAGNFKISNFITTAIADGGILVVDEFDKLVRPKHNSKGDNVSLDVQAELLKLLEGEYAISGKKNVNSKKMGFVMVGAFESLREEKKNRQTEAPRVGFCAQPVTPAAPACETLSDGDFIRYGIMPEIVGRIAAQCAVAELNETAYLQIIRNPNSRVSQIEKVLKAYGTDIDDVLSEEELRGLIAVSRSNRTGVRWVCAQVEGRLLESIRNKGLGLLSA